MNQIVEVYKNLQIRPLSILSIDRYVYLLNLTFKKGEFTSEYLHWLYFENPNGYAIGYDAYDGDLLVGHYACIPIELYGLKRKGLLSLNTAVHPKYQSRGIFGVLAKNTFENAKEKYSCVIGVANSRSLMSFIRHLDFQYLGDLNLRFGLIRRNFLGARVYSTEEIQWRTKSPNNQLKLRLIESKNNAMVSLRFKHTIKLKASIPLTKWSPLENEKATLRLGFTIDWQLGHKPLLQLPKRLKPSPLSLIFRDLGDAANFKLTSWSFPDFDAL